MKHKVISLAVYEDNAGVVRCYMIQDDNVRVFDEWEHYEFGGLRRFLYGLFAKGFDYLANALETEIDAKEYLDDDRRHSEVIVAAAVNNEGGVYVDVYPSLMGFAGKHAWGIEE